MAKHPHRLLHVQKKTWRCTLPNCRYFIHEGLAHTLPGQIAQCWGCSEEFMLDENALIDDTPSCPSCRIGKEGGLSIKDREDIINAQLALSRAKVKSVDELDPMKRSTMQALGIKLDKLKKVKKEVEKDEIEVIEPHEGHALNCGLHFGNECDCK